MLVFMGTMQGDGRRAQMQSSVMVPDCVRYDSTEKETQSPPFMTGQIQLN